MLYSVLDRGNRTDAHATANQPAHQTNQPCQGWLIHSQARKHHANPRNILINCSPDLACIIGCPARPKPRIEFRQPTAKWRFRSPRRPETSNSSGLLHSPSKALCATRAGCVSCMTWAYLSRRPGYELFTQSATNTLWTGVATFLRTKGQNQGYHAASLSYMSR